MKFLSPKWLWLLTLLPVCLLFIEWDARRRLRLFERFATRQRSQPMAENVSSVCSFDQPLE